MNGFHGPAKPALPISAGKASYYYSDACPLGRPLLRFKDSLKVNLKNCLIDPKTWEEMALNRPLWRLSCTMGISRFEEDRISNLQERRHLRKAAAESGSARAEAGKYVCAICDHSCTVPGLIMHTRSHQHRKI